MEKYLRLYAEPLAIKTAAWLLAATANKHWKHCIIVPAYGEAELGMRLTNSLASASLKSGVPNLIIFMINAHAETSPDILQENDELYKKISAQYTSGALAGETPSRLLKLNSHSDLLLIDCNSAPYLLPRKQAVGTARKIMADIATALFQGQVLSSPVCFSTDADALWPADFFVDLDLNVDGKTGLYCPVFKHDLDPAAGPDLIHLGRLYDQHMQHYCESVAQVIPTYGFTPIGGAMGFDLKVYAKVRGFPKKDAAEDFYLADKIVKISGFQNLNNPPISLSPRLSQRVPFGTGVSLQKISDEIKEKGHATTYNPLCFGLLEKFFTALQNLDSMAKHNFGLNDEQRLRLQVHFDEIQVTAACERLSDFPKIQRGQRLLEWFDALKILRFVNFCHRHLFEPIPLKPNLSGQNR